MPISMSWSRSLPGPSARSHHPALPRAECCSVTTMPFPQPATRRITSDTWQPRPSRANTGFSCGGRGARWRPTRSRPRSRFAGAPTANRRSVARFASVPMTSSCRSTCLRVVAWSRCSMRRSPRTLRPSGASARRSWPSNSPPSPIRPCRSRCRKAAAAQQVPPLSGPECPSLATGPLAISPSSRRFLRERTWLPAPSCRRTAGTFGLPPRRCSLAWGR